MDITLKLNTDFERTLSSLKNKYGSDFEVINGIAPSQLDFSEFIENFVSKDTMADATIDPNANARHKDIRSFMTEKGKSEDKLFCVIFESPNQNFYTSITSFFYRTSAKVAGSKDLCYT